MFISGAAMLRARMLLDDRIGRRLEALARQGLARGLPAVSAREGTTYLLRDRRVVGFCSNDYLGFADDPRLADTPRELASDPPSRDGSLSLAGSAGAGASRLVCGDLPEHRAVEARLAALVGANDAVLFPSGFQLNVSVPSCLIEAHDEVHSDALNHASLIDGLRLGKAHVHVLPHGEPPPAPAIRDADTLSWWVCESIDSMEGDRVDLGAIDHHLRCGGCVYVDEAHAIGLFERGRGLTSALAPTALVGTLGKAFGCAGAFVAASTRVCQWIRTRARGFVFSTGVSPVLVRRIDRALTLVVGPAGDERRERLWRNVDHLRRGLGLPLPAPSPIVSLVVGENQVAVELAERLFERGIHVQPIRPPTVPEGTARLRITLSALHEPAQIDHLLESLHEILPPRTTTGA